MEQKNYYREMIEKVMNAANLKQLKLIYQFITNLLH